MIVIASQNKNKVAEISLLEAAKGFEIKSIAEYSGCPDVEEDGTSFEENAAIKAMKYSLWLKREHGIWPIVIAEDSGLELEAMMGWPGVNSARVAETDEKKIALVEIIHGKGSGQLKKRVLRFLAQSNIKSQYHRLEKDDKNFGRVFVHFKH